MEECKELGGAGLFSLFVGGVGGPLLLFVGCCCHLCIVLGRCYISVALGCHCVVCHLCHHHFILGHCCIIVVLLGHQSSLSWGH